jgi:FMN phosphatase YigB (HAD superfamily)
MRKVFNKLDKKVIFFDLYDTLIDRQISFAHALKESLQEFTARWDSQDWDPALIVEAYCKEWLKKDAASSKRVRSSIKKRRLTMTKEQKQLKCLSIALQNSSVEVTDSFVRTVLQRTKELIPYHSALFPEAQDKLEQLRKQYTLALISNGNKEKIHFAIRNTGLSHIFPKHRIFVPASRRRKKPHQDIFKKALKIMKIQPSEAVMVGNGWKKDIFGANRCGIDAIWIHPKNKKVLLKRIGRNKVIFISNYKPLLCLFSVSEESK